MSVKTQALVRRCWPLAGCVTTIMLLCGATACRREMAAIDTAPGPARGLTISGTVRAPEGTRLVEGRTVEVVNVDTGERHRVSTDTAGGFSLLVTPGKYRVELALRQGESLIRRPGLVRLDDAGTDTRADFVLGAVPVSRPRPVYRMDDGLGSPIG